MADDEKKAGLDKAADEARKPPAPLKDPKVKVTVKPKEQNVPKTGNAPPEKIDQIKRSNQENKDLAKKVEKNLTEKVKDAVTKAAPGGAPDQFQAAHEAGEDAANQVSRRKIKKIEISVTEKGPQESTSEHVPKEGGDAD